MKLNIKKINKKFAYIILIVVILMSIIFGFLIINSLKQNKVEESTSKFIYDKQDYEIVTTGYDEYHNNYTLRLSPRNYGIQQKLFEMTNTSSDVVLDELKGLKFDYKFTQEDYDSLNKNLSVIKTNEQFDWSNLKDINTCSRGFFNSRDEAETNVLNNLISYPHSLEQLNVNTRGGKPMPYGWLTYNLYRLTYKDTSIMNLGTNVYSVDEDPANTKKYQLYACYQNIDPNSRITPNKEITHVNYMSYNRFLEDIKRQNNSMFIFGYIGSVSQESMDLKAYGIRPDSTVAFDKLSVEYVYLTRKSTLVPLIRVDGYVEGEFGKVKVTFWNWYIELENKGDTGF